MQMSKTLKISLGLMLMLSLPQENKACWWVNMFDWCGTPGDEFLLTDDAATQAALQSQYHPGIISQDRNYIIITTPFMAVSDANSLNDNNSNVIIQYFDGLGRLTQTVQRAITPNGKDLVSGVVYDAFGRKSGEWLPAAAQNGNNNGAYVPVYQKEATQQAGYSEGNPFSMTKYEPSPLNRVVEQYGPGKGWQSNEKSQKTLYGVNGTDVKCYYAEGDKLKCKGAYAAATLYSVSTVDEDGKYIIEYTDKLGRKIMTRTKENYDTYYVYDDFSNLCYVLPPAAADALNGVSSGFSEAAGSPVDLYAYIYRYDERQRNVVKKLPGCDSICMAYDRADRLIASQDGNQRAKSQWTVNKYDALGRLLYSGFYYGPEKRTDLKNAYSNTVANESYTGVGATGGYSCTNLTPVRLLTVNYYDNYGFLNQSAYSSAGTVLTNVNSPDYTAVDKDHTKALLTGTQTYHLDDSTKFETTAIYYDTYGRVVQTRATNHLGGYDIVFNSVDFQGKPLKTYKTHGINGASTTVTELYVYSYDKAQRLRTTTLSVNNGATVTLSDNSYDELGRLQTRKIGNNIETINYTYNIRSWVTGIQSSRFTELLSYNVKPAGAPCTPYYNGNISVMQWNIPDDGLTYNQAYAFTYDVANRLYRSDYFGINGGAYQSSVANKYSEFTGFDKMGNIGYFNRHDGALLNNLSLRYNGNRLKSVDDTTNPALGYGSEAFVEGMKQPEEYDYDKNGNMTYDGNTGISTIQYNALNLPDIMQFTKGHQNRYTYNAAGQKLNQTCYTLLSIINVPKGTITAAPTNTGFVKVVTDYAGDKIYQDNALKMILTPEGYWQNGVYFYYLKDHLGNNRVVVNGSNGQIVEKSHYYPSGMRFLESTSNSAAIPYRYGGKELEAMNGLNQYDFGARRRFAWLPVTTTMDPLCEN